MALEFMASKSTLILVLVSSILLHFYLKTMSPSIAGGDSGEIVAEGCQLGTGTNCLNIRGISREKKDIFKLK